MNANLVKSPLLFKASIYHTFMWLPFKSNLEQRVGFDTKIRDFNLTCTHKPFVYFTIPRCVYVKHQFSENYKGKQNNLFIFDSILCVILCMPCMHKQTQDTTTENDVLDNHDKYLKRHTHCIDNSHTSVWTETNATRLC